MNESLKLNKLFHIDDLAGALSSDTTYVGIDFGTSTTVVSVAVFNPLTSNIECFSLQLPQTDRMGAEMIGELFPTVIAINPSTGKPLYGQGAYDLKFNPDFTFGVNIWHSFKMELGKDLGPRWYESRQSKIKSPQDATRVFFKQLKRSIERAVKERGLPFKIKYAVSIPASFESNQRKDLMTALSANDIIVDGSLFIDEPNAAFIGYINSSEVKPIVLGGEYNPKVLVFDFGAGTCDISLLEITADHHGMHSNNLSISQFAELGGNDIDRYIANNFLLPQLLKANNLDGENDILTSKQKDVIAHQLYGYAENMKKRLCKEDFNYLLSDPEVMDEVVASGNGITIDTKGLAIATNNGTLTIPSLWLSYKDFIKTMNVFFKTPLFSHFGASTTEGHQKKYNSIVAAISTALEKAHVKKEEVDYVVMIGGSSRNPFVQGRIKKFFPNAEVLIPRELQALVSQGAALHSILINGIGIQAVRPIVGESILVVTQEGNFPVITAGTEVPFDTTVENVFTTGNKTYREIEIPVCVGSDKKMMYNLKLVRQNGEKFPTQTPVTLHFEMDSDKILKVKAVAMEHEWYAVCENPLDNAALTDGEAKVLKAQRESYISAEKNGNRPTSAALEALCSAYEENDQEFLAAETLEEMIMYYPHLTPYNRIGVLFHNSGNYNRAIAYFRKAVKETPENATAHNNLGHDLYLIGEYEEARKHLERAIELKGDYAIAITVLAKLEEAEKHDEKAKELYRRAYNIFTRVWQNDGLDDCSKGWFLSVARKVNDGIAALQLEQELKNHTKSRGYSLENTLFGNSTK